MNSFIVLALCVAAAVAIPIDSDRDAVVTKYENDNIGVDGFKYAVETSNGLNAREEGRLTNAGSEDEGIEVRGEFSYFGPDGVNYVVTYIADKNGFQPQGAHLPVA